MPTNILNLPLLEVDKVTEDEHDYHIHAHSLDNPTSCPDCQSKSIVGFGRNEKLVYDLPMHGKRVGIYFDTRRFQCKACGRTFLEQHSNFHAERNMTKRLVEWIGAQSLKRTFVSIAEETGVSEGTVRNIFRDYINDLEKKVRIETPTWMGIDEIHLVKPRGVITNIENQTVVEVLANRSQETITKYLSTLPGREKIQYVAMDMWRPYRNAVNEVLPQAKIVIDKFHVVRLANDSLERVRKAMREQLSAKQKRGLLHDRFILIKREHDLNEKERFNLDGWTKNYPLLGQAYQAKEAFYGIYESKSIHEASARYEAWQKSIPPELHSHFSDLITAFSNWQPYILNYFHHPITNSYTESLNNLILIVDRMGRGYSFEALRAKILFTESAQFKKNKYRPKFNRRAPDRLSDELFMAKVDVTDVPMFRWSADEDDDQHDSQSDVINYGASISTLIKLIEEGKI